MKLLLRSAARVLAACVVVGLVNGHGHGHHHGADGEEGEVPLHERAFVQDSVEELERKWSFEVCDLFLLLFYACGGVGWVLGFGFHVGLLWRWKGGGCLKKSSEMLG